MIKITIELVSARTGVAEVIAAGTIHNDATGNVELGNYEYSLNGKVWGPEALKREGRIIGFSRKLNIWHLLHQVLNSAFEE